MNRSRVRETPSGESEQARLDAASLARLLLFGSADTRHQIAARLLQTRDHDLILLLAETVRSNEGWLLRARCLEVLGIMAGVAERDESELILETLTAPR